MLSNNALIFVAFRWIGKNILFDCEFLSLFIYTLENLRETSFSYFFDHLIPVNFKQFWALTFFYACLCCLHLLLLFNSFSLTVCNTSHTKCSWKMWNLDNIIISCSKISVIFINRSLCNFFSWVLFRCVAWSSSNDVLCWQFREERISLVGCHK